MLTSYWCWQSRWLSGIFIKTWKTLKVSEALNRLLKVLIIAINAQSHSVDAPSPPWFGGGDHLCPYGRKLIGSLVPVHSRSVRSNTYAFLDPSLKLVAFLLNYFITDLVCQKNHIMNWEASEIVEQESSWNVLMYWVHFACEQALQSGGYRAK